MFWNKKIKFNSGALPDNRTQEEKSLDIQFNEVVASAAPVIWEKKTKYRSFPVRKQNGSGSCVMQGLEKERGIMAYLKYGKFLFFSSNSGYQGRDNIYQSGSTYTDLVRATEAGAVLEVLSPSQSMTDSQMMNADRHPEYADIKKIFGANRVNLPLDIDTIASTIQATGKGVSLTVKFFSGEWFYNYVAKLLPGRDNPGGHYIVAVDYTLNDAGEKCLIIEDSACEDGFPQRIVPESFLLARTYWSPSYMLNFKTYVELPDKPVFDGSVTSLQDCLKYEKLFPSNVPSTGVFGSVTKGALINFQKRYNIEPALGNFGPITKEKLLEIYK